MTDNITNIILNSLEKSPTGVADAVNAELLARLETAIEAEKAEVLSNMGFAQLPVQNDVSDTDSGADASDDSADEGNTNGEDVQATDQ